MYPDNVEKYLNKNSLKYSNLEWNEDSGIDNVVVVPAICEFENIKQLLLSLSSNSPSSLHNSLIIFVVNNSRSSNEDVKIDNKLSIDYLRDLIKKKPSDIISKQILDSEIRIGLIDVASEGKELDDKNAAVGLARKIGMDTALKIFDYSINNKKIIISLDADCLVEPNYLSEIRKYFNQQNVHSAIIDFAHILPNDEAKKLAILSYEIFLRQYVVGLLFAKSPFAFHTIGSTIVCDDEAYLKIGGMNTKKAAEDFYFLQKLAKHYSINKISSTKVKPSARGSWRVPFGTGRSMEDFSSSKKEILLYDPDVYVVLKDWLKLFNSNISISPDLFANEVRKIHSELYNFLIIRDFFMDWKKILNNSKSTKQLNYQRRNWFDAFETLKLIHHLRDTSFPMLDIKTGIEKLFTVVQHSSSFDYITQSDKKENLFIFYLAELKMLENNLHKNLYE